MFKNDVIIPVAIADDHQLFLKSLALLVSQIPNFEMVVEALNGKDLLNKLAVTKATPEIFLIDVDMPVMDGLATTFELRKIYPLAKIVALSMKDDDKSILSMLKAGCCAYLLKDIHPNEFEKALFQVYTMGYYYSDVTYKFAKQMILGSNDPKNIKFTQKEIIFLQLACSDLPYKEIASEMNLSERTIDGYRESLFEKLNVRSRTGMVLEALKRKIIKLD